MSEKAKLKQENAALRRIIREVQKTLVHESTSDDACYKAWRMLEDALPEKESLNEAPEIN